MKGLGRKIVAVTLLGVLVFGALVLYGDVSTLRRDLGAYAWSHFALALLLAATNYAVRFVRWEAYLGILGIRLGKRESALTFLSGFVMSITPGKVGEVWKSVLLSERHGYPVARTAPIVVAERLTDLLSLILLAAVGAVTFRIGWTAIAGGIGMVSAVLVTVSSRTVSAACIRLAGRLPLARRIAPKLEEAVESLQELVTPRRLVLPTFLAAAAWFCECLAYYEIFRGFAGVEVGLEPATFVYSVSTIAGAVAMMPGGLGVTELGMTGLIQLLAPDVGPSTASASTMLVRLATLWFAVAIGGAAYGLLRRAGR
ncbi:MAG: flippase-like domain-containing protein [Deltaproteobacteria bacterium]|nr:flippase-like domain-containing protein [Deltaproteobacteria bacterium]